jgi:hypothetical protein
MRRQASMMVWRFSRSFAANIHFPQSFASKALPIGATPVSVNQMPFLLATVSSCRSANAFSDLKVAGCILMGL